MSELLPASRFTSAGLKTFARARVDHASVAARWALLLIPTGTIIGSLCALFLWALDVATQQRFAHPWLLFGLPLSGGAVGLVYHWVGKSAEAGNNLIVDQIHEPGGGVPLRMAPLILASTVVTHLFGGSAGREGTAVQLGGSIASTVTKFYKLSPQDTRILLMAGIAAGFGAVFGTPVAGAVFALEVLTLGRIQYEALIPCLVAGLIGDWVCRAWGIHHTPYTIAYHATADGIDVLTFVKAGIAGAVFGLAALAFAESQHRLSAWFKAVVPFGPARPVIGGVVVIALVFAFGTRAYLGLGVWSPNPSDPTIAGFFEPGRVDHWSWLLKAVFTIVTLSAGFKGGEVTPLFFIGAALGNAVGSILGVPTDLFAALGFVAVFAGAANTPLACTIMGVELFGAEHTALIAVACFVAYLCSGHSGIYLSQRLGVPKSDPATTPANLALRQLRELRPRAPAPAATAPAKALKPKLKPEETPMTKPHTLTAEEVGMIRIYMRPGEKFPVGKQKAFFQVKPLYRHLVQVAKKAGIINAVAHQTHYGYSNDGRIQDQGAELSNPDLTMCVELIGPRGSLEGFCRDNGAALGDKIVIYKHLEQWRLTPHGVEAHDIIAADGEA